MSTLTETLRSNLDNPVSSPEFDLYTALDKSSIWCRTVTRRQWRKDNVLWKRSNRAKPSQIRGDVGNWFGRQSCSSICHLEI
jgi:hypothetical protein